MPALAITLHLLGKVDSFLAAATLVSSSERHSESVQEKPSCVKFSPTVSAYTQCLWWGARLCCSARGSPLPATTIPVKGEVPAHSFTSFLCSRAEPYAVKMTSPRLHGHSISVRDSCILLSCAERSHSTGPAVNKQEILHILVCNHKCQPS